MSKMTRGSDGKPWSFHDLAQEAFPVKVEARLDTRDGEVLWTRTIEPYVAVEIPPTPGHEGRVGILMHFADDPEPIWHPPIPNEEAREYVERRIAESQE